MSEEYDFEMDELSHVVKSKPTIFLIEDEYRKGRGIKALKEVLVGEYGFDTKDVRNICVRYPQIISKT